MKEVLNETQKLFVLDNLGLVKHILMREYPWCPPTCDAYNDMFQDGCLGLCLAVIRFNPEYGTQFSSYAYLYIKNYILEGIKARSYNYSTPLTVDRRTADDMAKVKRFMKKVPEASDEEILKNCDISYERLRLVNNIFNCVSLDATVCEGDAQLSEIITDSDAPSVFDQVYSKELYESVLEIIDNLNISTPYHKELFKEFIIDKLNHANVPQTKYAEKYRISRQGCHRIINKCLERFKVQYIKNFG